MVLNACRTRKQLPHDFIDLYASRAIRPSQDLFRIFEIAIEYTTKEEQKICEYVVQHAMMASSGDGDMDNWARERKMFPWVAVAAPLIVSHPGLEYCPFSTSQCRRTSWCSSHPFEYPMSDIVSAQQNDLAS
jgi:hypothetical protein